MSYSSVIKFINTINNCIVNEKIIIPENNHKIGCLICKTKPCITINDYIKRIFKSEIIDEENYDSIILHTINLLQHLKTKGIYLNNYSCHRIISTLLMLSSKIIDEYPHSNWYWATLCGVSLEDMNMMESSIIKILDYNLHIVISQTQVINIYKSIF
jgi:hypothetical protein|uniref:Cyclin N-terminal domain-containing protein n=1 Tax=viral metagenome TaxID=1070528 RepID=A0A6C0H4K8_9ZZZZ